MINKIEVGKYVHDEYKVTYSVDSYRSLTDILRRGKNSDEEIGTHAFADVGLA